MSNALTLLLSWIAGGALGLFFFCGLWWTVHRSLSAQQPALWFFGSLLVRTVTTLAGFYFVAAGHLDRLFLCLFGFVLARVVVARVTRPAAEIVRRPTVEGRHAP